MQHMPTSQSAAAPVRRLVLPFALPRLPFGTRDAHVTAAASGGSGGGDAGSPGGGGGGGGSDPERTAGKVGCSVDLGDG